MTKAETITTGICLLSIALGIILYVGREGKPGGTEQGGGSVAVPSRSRMDGDSEEGSLNLVRYEVPPTDAFLERRRLQAADRASNQTDQSLRVRKRQAQKEYFRTNFVPKHIAHPRLPANHKEIHREQMRELMKQADELNADINDATLTKEEVQDLEASGNFIW